MAQGDILKNEKSIKLYHQLVKLKPKITVADYFADLSDPFVTRTKQHELIDLITIAICAVICGANNWVAIETYGHAKRQWLQQFLKLPNGIPFHDTFAQSLPGEASPGRLCQSVCQDRPRTVSTVFSQLDKIYQ